MSEQLKFLQQKLQKICPDNYQLILQMGIQDLKQLLLIYEQMQISNTLNHLSQNKSHVQIVQQNIQSDDQSINLVNYHQFKSINQNTNKINSQFQLPQKSNQQLNKFITNNNNTLIAKPSIDQHKTQINNHPQVQIKKIYNKTPNITQNNLYHQINSNNHLYQSTNHKEKPTPNYFAVRQEKIANKFNKVSNQLNNNQLNKYLQTNNQKQNSHNTPSSSNIQFHNFHSKIKKNPQNQQKLLNQLLKQSSKQLFPQSSSRQAFKKEKLHTKHQKQNDKKKCKITLYLTQSDLQQHIKQLKQYETKVKFQHTSQQKIPQIQSINQHKHQNIINKIISVMHSSFKNKSVNNL